ncbi:MAG TPA: EscU/YscU/HrcU family type III secretion system export apparatus switch protein [Candidatus Binataceae bacterium]|nr:EscU/YscU/HrcU family type III secretion system export apparatus switch protein [Candidatus Binataceae bacterium]
MAERDEKIFPALPQKRQRAREQGNVARSRDLTGALVLAFAASAAAGALGLIGSTALRAFRQAFAAGTTGRLGDTTAAALLPPLMLVAAGTGLLAAVALLASAAQGGIVFAPARLAPDWKRLNPLSYFGRIFAVAGLIELGKAAAKIVLIALLGWETAYWALTAGFNSGSIDQSLGVMAAAVRRLLGWSAVIAVVTGAADYAHKRYEHETELRMTRQEFRDELKQEEGNPQVKRAIRRAMRMSAKRVRGIHQAATATVVLTNPTHYAVALRYRRGFDPAPQCVAKGAGERAHRLVAIARMAAVPIMPNPILARGLFRAVEVGDQIPRHFYRAVAEVLGMILRAEAARHQASSPSPQPAGQRPQVRGQEA